MMRLFFVVLGCFSWLFAQEQEQRDDVKKISTAMGHLIGKNLQTLGLSLDFASVVAGLQGAINGDPSPLSEEECVEAIALLQEEAAAKVSEESGLLVEKFLQETALKPEVLSLVEGKLLYSVEKKGEGDEVFSYNSPIVRYFGKTIDGKQLPVHEERLDLLEASKVFQMVVTGMKEGEVRTVYLHPEMEFFEEGEPTVSILQLELIKADASSSKAQQPPLFPKEIDRQLQ